MQSCNICLSPETGLHYRTVSCRACAAFFRRTIQKNLRYKCSKDGNCDVTHVNRFSCRFCRMKKCVDVGMEICDDQSSLEFHLDTPLDLDCHDDERDEFFNPENILGDPAKFVQDMQERIRAIFEAETSKTPVYSLCQQYSAARADFARKWPKCRPELMYPSKTIDINKDMGDYYRNIEVTAEFCMEIGPFRELPLNQKHVVFKHFLMRFIELMQIFVSIEFLGKDLNDSRMVAVNGQILDFNDCSIVMNKLSNWNEDQMKRVFKKSERKMEMGIKKPLKRMNADEFEKDFILGYCMWSVEDVSGVSEETFSLAQKNCERLAEELNTYFKFEKEILNYSSRIYKLVNLLTAVDRMTETMEEDDRISKLFQMLKFDLYVDDITGTNYV